MQRWRMAGEHGGKIRGGGKALDGRTLRPPIRQPGRKKGIKQCSSQRRMVIFCYRSKSIPRPTQPTRPAATPPRLARRARQRAERLPDEKCEPNQPIPSVKWSLSAMNSGVFESHFESCRSTGDGGLQTLSTWVPEGVRLQLWPSGLGVPGRRHSLGGFTGAFRFVRRINHQPHALMAAAHPGAPSQSGLLVRVGPPSWLHLPMPTFVRANALELVSGFESGQLKLHRSLAESQMACQLFGGERGESPQ